MVKPRHAAANVGDMGNGIVFGQKETSTFRTSIKSSHAMAILVMMMMMMNEYGRAVRNCLEQMLKSKPNQGGIDKFDCTEHMSLVLGAEILRRRTRPRATRFQPREAPCASKMRR